MITDMMTHYRVRLAEFKKRRLRKTLPNGMVIFVCLGKAGTEASCGATIASVPPQSPKQMKIVLQGGYDVRKVERFEAVIGGLSTADAAGKCRCGILHGISYDEIAQALGYTDFAAALRDNGMELSDETGQQFYDAYVRRTDGIYANNREPVEPYDDPFAEEGEPIFRRL